MKVRFVYPKFARHADSHPELRQHVPCNEYFGPPSLGIACLAAVTPPGWELDFRDDRLEDIGLDDDVNLVAISCFTPSAKRAMELADEFRARRRNVVMGGIFPTMSPDEVAIHADAVVVGEGEGVWPRVLDDCVRGKLEPRYVETTPVDLSTLPLPRVDLYIDKEGGGFSPDDYPVQTSRGCPLSCSACAIPAVMGRRLRYYDTAHVVGQIQALATHGKLGSFTEDTAFFHASNKRFMDVLGGFAHRAAPVSYLGVSMPMILATADDVLARMRAAGIKMFYLVGGFDPITRQAFTGKSAHARQQALDAVHKAMDHGIEPYTSFMVGNDDDDESVFDHILEFADEANIRKAEFAIMTPYPGTPVFRALGSAGRLLTKDWSLYNDANVVFRPVHMPPERLLDGYLYLWREFYHSRQHLRTLGVQERTIQF